MTNEGTLVFGDSEETGAIFTLNGDLVNMGTIASGSSSSTPAMSFMLTAIIPATAARFT